MTDRHSGYIVSLERDMSEDDAKLVRDALAMIKGVLWVEPVIADAGQAIAHARVRHEMLERLAAQIDKPAT